MASGSSSVSPATRVVLRAAIYYVVLFGIAALVWPALPQSGGLPVISMDAMFGLPAAGARAGATGPEAVPGGIALAGAVAVAMLASVLLALPVAWVYLATRAKRGYQQSVVQLLVILPAVVAGVVLLVKHSLALAFSLAGIVAAVRFRNTLDDSKDAVYVFLATAIGLSAAVNLPVAAVLSVGFNMIVLALWYTDFGSAPVALDGRIADQRLRRARQLARTGTFVARIDDEVLRDMTREQLEGVAARAWKRANAADDEEARREVRIRVRADDLEALRRRVEPRLAEHARGWRTGDVSARDGVQAIEYVVLLKKKSSPEDLLALVRSAGDADLVDAELV